MIRGRLRLAYRPLAAYPPSTASRPAASVQPRRGTAADVCTTIPAQSSEPASMDSRAARRARLPSSRRSRPADRSSGVRGAAVVRPVAVCSLMPCSCSVARPCPSLTSIPIVRTPTGLPFSPYTYGATNRICVRIVTLVTDALSSDRLAARIHLPLAGALTAFLAFRAGGFFPDKTAVAVLVLAIALLLRVMLVREPFAGLGLAAAIVLAALAGFACWMLASTAWSDAPGRAVVELDRALLYLLAMAFYASVPREAGDLTALLRWVRRRSPRSRSPGLLTRLLPDTFPISGRFLPERVSFPLTYWNAMGIACALGALSGAAPDASGPEPAVRPGASPPAAAARARRDALPDVLARGDLGAAGRARALRAARAAARAASTGAGGRRCPAAVAVKVAYGADCSRAPTTTRPPRPRARAASVALVVACARASRRRALRGAALPLDTRLERIRVAPARAPRACSRARPCAARAGAGRERAAATRRAARPPTARATFQWRTSYRTTCGRARPAHVGGRQRADRQLARRARRRSRTSRATAPAPARTGSRGTASARRRRSRSTTATRSTWRRCRSSGCRARAAASSRSARCLVGGAAAARRARAPRPRGVRRRRRRCSLVHAGVDWDWEMPALFVWLFGAAAWGRARGAARRAARRARPRLRASSPRSPCSCSRITPALFAFSQPPLDRAVRRSRAATAPAAIDAALTPRSASARAGAVARCSATATRGRPVRARPAGDGRRPRARPGQLAVRLRPGDRLRRLAARPAAVRGAEALRLNPLDAARARAGARPRGAPADRRPAGRASTRRAGIPVRVTSCASARACGGAAPGRRSAARGRRAGPGSPRSR